MINLLELPEGYVICGKNPEILIEELDREVGRGHPLLGEVCTPVARHVELDFILFLVGDGPKLALVYLTGSGREELYPAPHTLFYEDGLAWFRGEWFEV